MLTATLASLDLATVGISHQTAPLALREAFAIVCHRLFKNRPQSARAWPSVLISTCNRCELYLSAQSHFLSGALHLLDTSGLPLGWKEHLYIHTGEKAFGHLCKVTCGLYSAFFGETQIQGQVKVAYSHACEQPLTADLHFAFQRTLQISKRVRQEALLHGHKISLEKLVDELIDPEGSTLFIGASATNELLIDYFFSQRRRPLVLINRSHSPRAQRLAKKPNLTLLPWEMIDRWPLYTQVIVATTSPHYLDTFTRPLQACTTERIFDLSVPCNVDPSLVSAQPGLTLFNIDDLKNRLKGRSQAQRLQYQKASQLIDELTQSHLHNLRARTNRYGLIMPSPKPSALIAS